MNVKKATLVFTFLFCTAPLLAQTLYFPPVSGDEWATTSMDELGWCADQLPELCDYLDENNTKAFLVLKDGKIVIEKYFGTFEQDSIWYWASAGKTITAVLTGIAQQEGDLDINDKSSDYLGTGWTDLTLEQENNITVKHQLSMITGLDDETGDVDCTDPECLVYKAKPTTRWAYHNAPYTLLDQVIDGATGFSLNAYCNTKLEAATGMSGLFFPLGYNNVYFSKPRDMARFGLMMLGGGTWDGTPVITDAAYYNQMITPSQELNESYGYLWWLNGQDSFMLPGSQTVFSGQLSDNAPADMYSAIGKNGQYLNIVPSQNLIVIRMGSAPDGLGGLVPTIFNNELWDLLNEVICETTTVAEKPATADIVIYPNPSSLGFVTVEVPVQTNATIYDSVGRLVFTKSLSVGAQKIDCSKLDKGMYYVAFQNSTGSSVKPFVIE